MNLNLTSDEMVLLAAALAKSQPPPARKAATDDLIDRLVYALVDAKLEEQQGDKATGVTG